MWSYDGWNQLNFVSQELKDPVRNFPIVICVGIPLGTASKISLVKSTMTHRR